MHIQGAYKRIIYQFLALSVPTASRIQPHCAHVRAIKAL
jgi:hypothetical protein